MRNALIAAVVAALVASGSAMATRWISGRMIRPHSIPLNRLAGHLPRGPRGPQGVAGTFDPSKVTVATASSQVPAGDEGGATANCPAGAVALGGGGLTSGIENLQGSSPHLSGSSYPTGWEVLYGNSGSGPITVSAYAVCAAP